MRLGMVGLGKMGANMAVRLVRGSHDVVAFDRSPDAVARAAAAGCVGSGSLADMVARLSPPRIVWVMVPSGNPTEETISDIADMLSPGDVVIDGGNSNYHDTRRREAMLSARDIRFLDAGTSGGVWGLDNGYCLMVGGDRDAYDLAEPIFRTLAPPDGCAHVGPTGAGHFAKMVHNGIEYGMLQAYGEGFEILRASDYELDLHQLAELWNRGSVIRSWILELAEHALAGDPDLDGVRGFVEDSGEGRWTVQEAIDHNVPAPVLTLSLLARFTSRQDEAFSAKFIAALRREFGGHQVKTE